MMNLKQSIFALLSLISLGMAADVHVVKVAVINGKRYELKELPTDPVVPEMMKMNKRIKRPHWSGASFHPHAPPHKGPETQKEDHTASNNECKKKRKNGKCPVRRRFRKVPVFIKVIKVHERVVVDPHHHIPIYKVVRTYNRLYLKAPKKPLKRISSTADKKVFGNKEKMKEYFEKGQQQQATSKVHKANNEGRFKETDKQFIMFLLGMSSTLCLFGIAKALMYLFSPDEQKHHTSYSKVANDENRILLEVEERSQNSPPQSV